MNHAPPDFVEAVCHAIATHRFRANNPPQTIEAQILYDADKLDSIGAIGVARAFAFAGHRNQRLSAADGADDHTPLQEYRQKLVHVKDRLLTASARKLARQRHAYMVAFFEQLAAEIEGDR